MALGVGSVVVDIVADLSRFTAGITQANSGINSFAQTASKKLGAMGKQLTTKVTLPIVGLGIAIAKTGIEFEQKMADVKAVSGATGDEMKALTDKAKEMGRKTKFSAKEAGAAFEYMGLAGWKSGQMIDGVEGIMDLAAASGEDLAMVSDIVTDGLSAFGQSAKESGRLADILAAGSSSANTTVGQLGESFKYVAPMAGSLNFTMEDTVKVLGLMANAGIKSSMAGTAMRGWMTRMVKPTEESAKAMKELGIQVKDSNDKMLPLEDIVVQVREKFKGLTDAQKGQYAAMLVGQTGISGFLAVVNATETDLGKLTAAVDGSTGAAKKMAEIKMDTLNGQIKLLKAKLEGLAIEVFPLLTPHIETFVDLINRLTDAFAKLSDGQKQMIVNALLIVAAIGPVLIIISKLIPVFMFLFNILKIVFVVVKALGAIFLWLFTPIGLVVVAIGTLIGIGWLLYKNWDKVVNFLMKMWTKFKIHWNGVATEFRNKANENINAVKGFFTNLGESIKGVWERFKAHWNGVAQQFRNKANENINAVKGFFTGLRDKAVGAFTTMVGKVTGKITEIKNKINGMVTTVKEKLRNMFQFKIPKIKLPHFSISGKLSVNPPSVPKLSVKWYKNGGILNSPTLIGAGEAGREAVVPLSGLASQQIARALNEMMTSANAGTTIININGYQKSPQELSDLVIKKMDRNVYKRNFAKG